MKKLFFISELILCVAMLISAGCAVNPTCPGNLLPIMEVQVNNTASNHDDYASTSSYTQCRARISNFSKFGGGQNFPGGVQVEIRNPLAIPNLSYSTSGSGAGSTSLIQTMPGDGSWQTFYIKGISNNTVDKSTIIEMATAGATCNEVVLARKALMVTAGAAPIAAGQPQVEIEVGSVTTLDDYLTWAPTYCRMRWANGSAGSTLNVNLRNMSGTSRLAFANSALAGGHTATNSTLPLALSGSGDWMVFYMAGNYIAGPGGNASVNDKDAVMEVVNTATSSLLSREGVMVRIRKNANNLTAAETERYLEALKKLDLTYNDYINFVKTHARGGASPADDGNYGFAQAHRGSGFLSWHRAFILHLERLLQAADPSVALPYWKFDANAPNIFSADFMGSNSAGNYVTLSASNPIVSWSLPGEGVATGVLRKTPYGDGGHPATATEVAVLALGSSAVPAYPFSSFKTMQESFHDPAHFNSGSLSWIGPDPSLAVRDPLFFFLHCNVDHAWAKWQWLRNRNNPADILSYDLQGSYATPAPGVATPALNFNSTPMVNRTLGQYADDTMWPWNNVTGGTGTARRPTIAILTPFPITVGAILPGSAPTVKSVIDYLYITGTSPASGLGFAYDDFFPY